MRSSGIVERVVGVWLGPALALALWLLWTNPAAPDLARIKFYVTAQDSLHAAWIVDVPLYTVAFGDTTWRARPGQPDSLAWGSACRSAPTRYAVSCAAVDTAGNESGPSNVVDFVVLP